jgi:hypothetical protein
VPIKKVMHSMLLIVMNLTKMILKSVSITWPLWPLMRVLMSLVSMLL